MNKFSTLCLVTLLTLSIQCESLGAVPAEKIHIVADHMQANIKSGHSVYTGNVRVTQGDLLLTGDKITVVQKNNEVERITVTGNPAHYNHVTEKGEVIKANSEKMVYTASKNKLVLTINANLNHPEYQISSQKIIYDTLNKVAIAGDKPSSTKPDNNKRVNITLTPKVTTSDKKPANEAGARQ